MELLRRIMLAGLAAVMILTTGPMALARAAPDGTTLVICTGSGLSTITIDANGNEIAPSPVCPDCLILKALLGGIAPEAQAPDTYTYSYRISSTPSAILPRRVKPDARGPPNI